MLDRALALWFASSLLAAVAAQAPAPTVAAAPAVVHGRVEVHAGVKLLRVWGTPHERGYAHGKLLAADFVAVALPEFVARFARQPAMLQQARGAVGRLIEYPEDVQQELQGLWQGLQDSKVDLRMAELDRTFDHTDLLVANALDVFGLMGCSSFTVWGERVQGGGVLTARNFDWPLTGAHMLVHTMLIVQHFADGRAVASVGWPGYIGTVTGVSDQGTAAFLHVGTGKITYTPEPSSWPTAIAARRVLAHGVGAEPAALLRFAEEQLEYTSPPAGFLTHLVLPVAPKDGSPAIVFETDAKDSERGGDGGRAGTGLVLTNHFQVRQDGRPASRDSVDREKQLHAGIAGCLAVDDKVVSIEEAWTMLGSVQRGRRSSFGTLHALVFRHAPWCFELRIGDVVDDLLVPAPTSQRRLSLTKAELFAPIEAK